MLQAPIPYYTRYLDNLSAKGQQSCSIFLQVWPGLRISPAAAVGTSDLYRNIYIYTETVQGTQISQCFFWRHERATVDGHTCGKGAGRSWHGVHSQRLLWCSLPKFQHAPKDKHEILRETKLLRPRETKLHDAPNASLVLG